MSRVLNREDAVLVVVDVQERLVPAIDKELYARSLKNFKIVIETAGTLGLPIVLTEQYPKGLGRTVPEVLQALDDDGIGVGGQEDVEGALGGGGDDASGEARVAAARDGEARAL